MTDSKGQDPAALTPTRRGLLRTAGVAALGGAAMSALGPVGRALAQNRIYQWGSSSLGSTGYQIITTLAAAVSKHTDLRCSALSTAGGAENMALIGEGIIDFGQSTTTDWYPAINGLGRYEGNPVDAVQMFSYTVWQCTPMVRADSDIRTLEDLRGKRVMPAAAGGATAGLWHTLFQAAGLYDAVDWTYGSWRESYDALASQSVDCIPSLLTAGDPSGVMQELATSTEVRILPISEELIRKAQEMNPGVMASVLTPEEYAGVSEPTRFVSFAGILATSPRVSEEVAYTVTKAIYENAEDVRSRGGPRLKDIRIDFATKYLIPAYPVHPGAARYLKEAGVWRDDLKIAS